MKGDHFIKCFIRAFLAGMSISIGACVLLGVVTATPEYKWVGAILFSIGLFSVFTFGFDLYTGKVGYLVDNKPSYLLDLVVIILGNFVGCLFMSFVMPESCFGEAAVYGVADAKLVDPDWFRIFCKGIFCGILMFIAADVYKTQKSYLGAFICVPVFILAGSEHSIADMFYFCCAGVFTLDALIFIIIVILGNAVGGIIIPLCRKYMYEQPAPIKQE